METIISNSKIVKNKSLTIAGIRGNQDSQQDIFDEIGRKHNLIKHISMPDACQVVWSIDKEENLYNTFIGCVVGELESIPEEMEVQQIEGGSYAAFEFTGKPSAHIEFLQSVFYDWFPNVDYKYNDEDCSIIQFHKTHPEDVDVSLPEQERTYSWEIWFPVK